MQLGPKGPTYEERVLTANDEEQRACDALRVEEIRNITEDCGHQELGNIETNRMKEVKGTEGEEEEEQKKMHSFSQTQSQQHKILLCRRHDIRFLLQQRRMRRKRRHSGIGHGLPATSQSRTLQPAAGNPSSKPGMGGRTSAQTGPIGGRAVAGVYCERLHHGIVVGN